MNASTGDSGLVIVIQDAVRDAATPPPAFLRNCVREAFGRAAGEVTVRIVDASESAALNERYRGKSGPTNVLAFEAGDWPVPDDEPAPLGDIVICAPVVADEAAAQGKRLDAHWAHLLIHGSLHLQGYDHESPVDASAMETRERELLDGLGIEDPYRNEA